MTYKLDLYDYEDKYVTSMFPYTLDAIPIIFEIHHQRAKDLLYGELTQIDKHTGERISIGLVGSDGNMLTRQQVKVLQLKRLMDIND